MNAKAAFLASPHRPKFERITETEEFQRALEYALLALIQDQALSATVSDSWDHHSHIVGARRFIAILETLHLPEQAQKAVKFPNLKQI